jgi:hypothetical protein
MSKSIPATGPISMSQMASVWGGTAPHKFSEYYFNSSTLPLSGIPTNGKISLGNFRGRKIFSGSSYTSINAPSPILRIVISNNGTAAVSMRYTGNIYIYTISNNAWSQQTILTPSDSLTNNDSVWCYSLSISDDGNTLAATRHTGSINNNASYIFTVYYRSGTTWQEQTRISLPSTLSCCWNGAKLSADGNSLVVSYTGPGNGPYVDGRALLYIRTGTIWTLSKTFAGPSSTVSYGWISNISGDGNTIAVSGNDGGDSSVINPPVYVYVKQNDVWSSAITVQSAFSQTNAWGFATGHESINLSYDGTVLAISNPYESDLSAAYNPTTNYGGAVYFFYRNPNNTYTNTTRFVTGIDRGYYFGDTFKISYDGKTFAASIASYGLSGGGSAAGICDIWIQNGDGIWQRVNRISNSSYTTMSPDGLNIVTFPGNFFNYTSGTYIY